MPIKVMDGLPAREVLQNEGIFVMDESRAFHQDIRPLRILILNLMPIKQVTEVQLLRLLGNTPLQIDVSFIHTESYKSKNTAVEYLNTYYRTFTDVKNERFDGMIITGAPIEHLAFEDVSYWPELVEIMEWTKSNVTSTFHICWGAQAGLYYHYGVNKHPIDKKAFGIFPHYVLNKSLKLFRGFDDVFYVPHSRHTTIKAEAIEKAEGISIASVSDDAGVYIVISDDRKQIFVTGHSEYDPDSLKSEYERDIGKGLCIDMPKNYFMDNNPLNDPVVRWRSHANLLFSNWLNYYVYQETPYEISV